MWAPSSPSPSSSPSFSPSCLPFYWLFMQVIKNYYYQLAYRYTILVASARKVAIRLLHFPPLLAVWMYVCMLESYFKVVPRTLPLNTHLQGCVCVSVWVVKIIHLKLTAAGRLQKKSSAVPICCQLRRFFSFAMTFFFFLLTLPLFKSNFSLSLLSCQLCKLLSKSAKFTSCLLFFILFLFYLLLTDWQKKLWSHSSRKLKCSQPN